MSALPENPTGDDGLERWPLQVRLSRRRVGQGLWAGDSWSVTAIASARDGAQGPSCVTFAADGAEHFDWTGLSLALHRDERPAYRFNLDARTPRLFVHCHADPAGRMVPALLTASQDVAASYMDGGEEDVFSIPMPAAIQCWIAAFIARHGEPELMLGKGHRRQRGQARPEGQHRG